MAKLAGSGAGRRGLLTEYLASGMARSLGLAVPAVRPLFLAAGFPWQIGTDEFDDLVQRSVGWNLGVAFIPDARPLSRSELLALPPDFHAGLACADRLLQNVDRRAENPNLLAGPDRVWAIDHGSCLFVNRIAAGRDRFDFRLPPGHFLAGSPAETASCASHEKLDAVVEMAVRLVGTCPDEWLDSLPFSRAEFLQRLSDYVRAFAKAGE